MAKVVFRGVDGEITSSVVIGSGGIVSFVARHIQSGYEILSSAYDSSISLVNLNQSELRFMEVFD